MVDWEQRQGAMSSEWQSLRLRKDFQNVQIVIDFEDQKAAKVICTHPMTGEEVETTEWELNHFWEVVEARLRCAADEDWASYPYPDIDDDDGILFDHLICQGRQEEMPIKLKPAEEHDPTLDPDEDLGL